MVRLYGRQLEKGGCTALPPSSTGRNYPNIRWATVWKYTYKQIDNIGDSRVFNIAYSIMAGYSAYHRSITITQYTYGNQVFNTQHVDTSYFSDIK